MEKKSTKKYIYIYSIISAEMMLLKKDERLKWHLEEAQINSEERSKIVEGKLSVVLKQALSLLR